MHRIVTALFIVLATCATAGAQTASELFLLQRTAALNSEVVLVADDGGASIRGRLIEITDAMVELELATGRRRFDLSHVARVERPGDPIIDGVFKGMGVAAGWCALACGSGPNGDARGAAFVSRVALGGLIGGAIDRRIKRKDTLYRRGGATPTIAVGVGRKRVGVAVVY